MHKILEIEYINKTLFNVVLEKKNLKFTAGHHFSLSIPSLMINREYSSFSAENDKFISFHIRLVKDGILTNSLLKLKKDDEIDIHGPFGNFLINSHFLKLKKIICISSGTGVAPFISMKKSYESINFELIHGIRDEKDIFDELSIFNNLDICISRSKSNIHYNGRVTNFLMDNLSKYSKDWGYFICGNSDMINDVIDILNDKLGVNNNNILVESFF